MKNIKGLMATIQNQQPSDAVPGQITKSTALSLYPATLDQIENLIKSTGINNRSQLVRTVIDFAKSHEAEFAEYLAATNPGVKAG